MNKVQFHTLAVGTKFIFQGIEYIKIETERVSCCTSLNASVASNPESKKFIIPVSEVEVND